MRIIPKRFLLAGVIVLFFASANAHTQSLPGYSLPASYGEMEFVTRSSQLDTSGAWIETNTAALKCFVKSDGIHAVTYSWLENAGIVPGSIDPSRIRIICKGEPVPYYPQGLNDGAFHPGDALYFIGKRNYGEPDYYRQVAPDVPHPQYLNKYSDSTAYWLFFDAPVSPTIPKRTLQAGGTVLDRHLKLQHYEPELSLQHMGTDVDRINFAEWTREDTWIMQFIQPGQTKTLAFDVENYLPGRNPVIRAGVAGYQGAPGPGLDHKLLLRLRSGPLVDSASFGSTDQVVLTGMLPSSSISDGSHILEVESKQLQPTFTRAVIDNYEIEYLQRLVAGGNRLNLGPFPVDGEVRNIRISGITDTNCIILSDCKYGSYAVQPKYVSDGGAYAIFFTDTVYAENRYYLSSPAAALLPSSPARIQPRDMRTSLPRADWLAITSDRFLPAVQEYAQFIEDRYNTAAAVATVEDIYDSYSYGIFNPEAVKLFLYDVLKSRKSSETRPFIALIGDANSNFKDRSAQYPENFVPGYGFPVSDALYVAFDSLGIEQQAYIGRIPVRSADELRAYQSRHDGYRLYSNDDWHKTVVLVSGGDAGENDAQLAFYRNINEKIAATAVEPAPFGGKTTHIYKTATPPSQFGPYSEEGAKAILQEGGIAISYVGHSATTQWDNGIDGPEWFNNPDDSYKFPLITDFGCSSGKFAEPNTLSFSEQFVSAGDARGLSYIGNSAFGYRSTAQSFPAEFYQILLKQGVAVTGTAHALARFAMIERFGPTIALRNAVQMSTLLGDPILKLALPDKPDPAVHAQDISTNPATFTDGMDSLRFSIPIHNYGLVDSSRLTIEVEYLYEGSEISRYTLETAFPHLQTDLQLSLPAPGSTGDGLLRITLDPVNAIEEMDESNNFAEYAFSILNSGVKIINRMPHSSGKDTLTVLNPYQNPGSVNRILIAVDDSPEFGNPIYYNHSYGHVATFIPMPPLEDNKKHYIRLELDGVTGVNSDSYAIWGGQPLEFFQKDSLDWSTNELSALRVSDRGITTLPAERSLRVISAGAFDGSLADVLLEGASVFPPLAVQGYYIAVFDRDSMTVKETRAFATLASPAEADSLAAFIVSRTGNELIAAASSADPAANRSRFASAFRSIGAIFADSVQQQGSYAVIGTPGAAPGSANERYTAPMDGAAIIDTAVSAPSPQGIASSYRIGPAGSWHTIVIDAEGDLNASKLRIIGLKRDGTQDIVLESLIGGALDISHIDAKEYPWLILEMLLKNGNSGPPVVHSWGVDYTAAPELAMNYQSVNALSDSAFIGQETEVLYHILNAGETPSQETVMAVTQTGPDGSTSYSARRSLHSIVPRAGTAAGYDTAPFELPGTNSVSFQIDPDNVILDQIAGNNSYKVELQVASDTTRPLLNYTFNNIVPMDGDFIPAKPFIRLELQTGYSGIYSASAFQITLDGRPVSMAGPEIEFMAASGGNVAVLNYKPTLTDGMHEFRFNAVTPSNVKAYAEDEVLNLSVSTALRIKELYPVPNPFSESTTFSFMLGGLEPPERAEIKIYTIAGRLINKMDLPPARMRIGYNTIPWDGRDADGDRLANGTYFYRLTVFSHSGTASGLGKLSILR